MPVSTYHYSPYYPNHFEPYADQVPLSPQDYSAYSPDYASEDYSPRDFIHHHQPHRDFVVSRPEYVMSNSLQSPSPSVPIDPALALYPPYYNNNNNYSSGQHHAPSHLSLPSNYSSPSSQTSETVATPPTEHMYPASSSTTGKRPASASMTNESRKKPRKDDEASARSPTLEKEEKAKPTRGSRYVIYLSFSTHGLTSF